MNWIKKEKSLHNTARAEQVVYGEWTVPTAHSLARMWQKSGGNEQFKKWRMNSLCTINNKRKQTQNIYTHIHGFVLHRNIRCTFCWTAPQCKETCARDDGRISQRIMRRGGGGEGGEDDRNNIAKECLVKHKLMPNPRKGPMYLQRWDAGITVVNGQFSRGALKVH